MKTVALYSQNEVVIDGDVLADHMTISQVDSIGNEGDEIVITKPCIRTFIKALTKVADAMGA